LLKWDLLLELLRFCKFLARAAMVQRLPGVDDGFLQLRAPMPGEEGEPQRSASSSGDPFMGSLHAQQDHLSAINWDINACLDQQSGWAVKPGFGTPHGSFSHTADLLLEPPPPSFMPAFSHEEASHSASDSFAECFLSPYLFGGKPNPAMGPSSACATGHMPSFGSTSHAGGDCVPCKFHRGRRGCKDGERCALCHFPHEELTDSGVRRAMRKKGLEKRQQLDVESGGSESFGAPAPSTDEVGQAFGMPTHLNTFFPSWIVFSV